MTLHVLFKVDGAEYVLPATDVLHMESFDGATKVPGTPAHVAGIVQSRGRVIPVVDLRVRFGLPHLAPTIDSRVVVVEADTRAVGLLVDSAREVVSIPADGFRAPPEVVTKQGDGFVKSVAQAGKRLVMLLDYRKVIGEELPHGE
jgi:purine-binding chemotaxis protein CheW